MFKGVGGGSQGQKVKKKVLNEHSTVLFSELKNINPNARYRDLKIGVIVYFNCAQKFKTAVTS